MIRTLPLIGMLLASSAAGLDSPVRPSEAKTSKARQCIEGQSITGDTAGNCCWPGQAWSGDLCLGLPTSCPSGFSPDAETQACVQQPCEYPRERTSASPVCCLPGQIYAKVSARCVGVPKCPEGWSTEGEQCVDVAEKRRAEEGKNCDCKLTCSNGMAQCQALADAASEYACKKQVVFDACYAKITNCYAGCDKTSPLPTGSTEECGIIGPGTQGGINCDFKKTW
jgi:hypothetical protein